MTTLTMPWHRRHSPDTCFICGGAASNIIFSPIYECVQLSQHLQQNRQNKQYFACSQCYDIVRTDIIPKDNLSSGLISNYKYYGTDASGVLSSSTSAIVACQTPMIKYEGTDTPISLTCCYRPQYIVINKSEIRDDQSTTVSDYFVPIFFKKRIKGRNTSMIRHYNLEKLYNENPGIIGYYEIEVLDLSKDEVLIVNMHNQNLFKMALANNTMATTVIDLSRDKACYFTLLPIELVHIIIKFVLKNEISYSK